MAYEQDPAQHKESDLKDDLTDALIFDTRRVVEHQEPGNRQKHQQ